MHFLKILKPFLRMTADSPTPTDSRLDCDIEYARMLLHNLSPLMRRIVRAKVKRFFRYRWKFALGRVAMAAVIVFLGYFAFVKVMHVKIVQIGSDDSTKKETCLSYPSDSTMNLRNFLLQIAYSESHYKPYAHRDSSQYWGLYQMGTTARQNTGYGDIPFAVWNKHPEIQDLAMVEMLKQEKKIMQKHIDKYSGKIVDGILVTESGILALCQLGCGAAQHYLDSGIIPNEDENGNHPRYLLKLGGYRLNLEKVRYSIQDAVIGEPTIK